MKSLSDIWFKYSMKDSVYGGHYYFSYDSKPITRREERSSDLQQSIAGEEEVGRLSHPAIV